MNTNKILILAGIAAAAYYFTRPKAVPAAAPQSVSQAAPAAAAAASPWYQGSVAQAAPTIQTVTGKPEVNGGPRTGDILYEIQKKPPSDPIAPKGTP